MKKKIICKRCKGRGKTFDKPKNLDGVYGFGRFKINQTDPDGIVCKSCNGTGYKN
jgi:RecJ-like exonuclease